MILHQIIMMEQIVVQTITLQVKLTEDMTLTEMQK